MLSATGVVNQRRETLGERYCRRMLIGYARVSTAEQNPAHQVDALVRGGVAPDDVHLDHASGAKASRPQLDLVLKLLRTGDTLVVTRLDRLGRSVLHLVTLGAALRERGVGLRVIEQGIDTSTAEGRAMFGMLSVLAEAPNMWKINRPPGVVVSRRPLGGSDGRVGTPHAGRAPEATGYRRGANGGSGDRGPAHRRAGNRRGWTYLKVAQLLGIDDSTAHRIAARAKK
jgi:hypothetical protein